MARDDRRVGTATTTAPATATTQSGSSSSRSARRADPTGDYYHFYILYTDGTSRTNRLIGTSGDKITIGVNEHVMTNAASNCTSGIPFDAGSLTTFDWANMLSFPALPDFTYDFDFDMFAPRPAVSPQGVSNTIFVVSEGTRPGRQPSRMSGTCESRARMPVAGPCFPRRSI